MIIKVKDWHAFDEREKSFFVLDAAVKSWNKNVRRKLKGGGIK